MRRSRLVTRGDEVRVTPLRPEVRHGGGKFSDAEFRLDNRDQARDFIK